MQKKLIEKIIFPLLAITLITGVFLVGFRFGQSREASQNKIDSLINKTDDLGNKVDFGPFWKTWNLLNEKYVDFDGTDDQARVWGAIQGLASSFGDPYTVFLPPEENELFASDIAGNFTGVGMEIGIRDGILTVIAPLKDTPADRAGIKSGDKILKIDDVLSSDFSTDKAVKLIRGEKGTPVKFSLMRDEEDKPLEITVVRDIINIPTIKTESKGKVFIIYLYSFTATSPDLFREALREFKEGNQSGKVDKLILDLRGNPGGYMEAAVDMASWFLPAGKTVVIEDFGGTQENKIHRSKGYDIFNKDLKFVILVDGGSASASEILAGALQEHGIATLVGEQTFGKGSVQEVVEITPETSLKVTIARWLTPNGVSISKEGLTPDTEVEFTLEDFKAGLDPQFEKAIEILNK